MPNEEKQQFVIKFIANNFKKYSFDRMQEYNDDKEHMLFGSYAIFLEHNEECVEKLNTDELDFVYMLCKQIRDNKIIMVDEEDFGEWKATAIYYNRKRNLTIMHPR